MKKVKFYLCAVLLSAVLFASCSNGSSSGNDDSSFPEQLLSYVGDETYKSPKNASVEDAENQSTDLKDGWWNDTAFYHIQVKYIAPYETRVYYIGDNTKEMIFTDKRLFLRGDMNSWGYDEMLYDSEKRCFDLWYKLDPDSYKFKFDAYCDWTLSYGSGEENTDGKPVSLDEKMQTSTEEGQNTNFLFMPSSSGTYRFTFYEDDNTFIITQE